MGFKKFFIKMFPKILKIKNSNIIIRKNNK